MRLKPLATFALSFPLYASASAAADTPLASSKRRLAGAWTSRKRHAIYFERQMLPAFLPVLISLVTLPAIASEEACSSLASRAEAAQEGFHPPAEAKVIGTGKLAFYEAPSVKCEIKELYAAPNAFLTVYRIHDGWANVMFIAKNGKDIVAWVPSDRLKIVGRYGRNP